MSTGSPEKTLTLLRWGLDSLLAEWLPTGENWSEPQLLRADSAVRSIGAALGVFDETRADPVLSGSERYQWLVIERAVEAEVRKLVCATAPEWSGFSVRSGRGHTKPGLFPATMAEKVDINRGSEQALESLPGIGGASAQRIVQHRESQGPFEDLEAARTAARLSRAAFEKATPFLTVRLERDAAVATVKNEVLAGGFRQLIEAIAAGRIQVSWTRSTDRRDILLDALDHFASQIRLRSDRPRYWVPSPSRLVRAAIAMDLRDIRAADRESDRDAKPTKSKVAPVPNSAYLPLLESLISGAKERLWASMFFFHVEGEDSPGGRIIASLKAAQDRGVDVRIILDHDLPGDYHSARWVNEGAFAAAKEAGLSLRPSLPDVTLHGKAVAVDSETVLVGSHNWTSSSFYRYEETSLLVESAQLNEQVASQHEPLWKLLAEQPDDRVVQLSMLELLDPWQKSALRQEKVETDEVFVRKARLIAGRRKLGQKTGLAEDEVEKLRDVVVLMKAFRISELTAVALVWHGLDTVAQVRRAPRDEVEAALSDLSKLPDPFRLRRIPSGMIDYLWKLK